MSTRRHRELTLGIMIMVLALFFAACGTAASGEDDQDGVASLGTDTTVGSEDGANDTSEVEAPTDRNEAFLLYDQCMAEQGFPTDAAGQTDDGTDVVTNEAGGGDGEGPSQRLVGPGGIEIAPEDLEAFEAANQMCGAHLANISQAEEFTPEQQAALEDANLRMQQCLDEKGIDAQISILGGDTSGLIQNEDSGDDAPPPNQGQVDPKKVEAAMAECMAIFDEYPELADVVPPPPGS